MADLATAYVQIIPSARGMESNLTGLLNGKMPAAGKSAGSVLGSSIVGAVKKVTVGGHGSVPEHWEDEGALTVRGSKF